MKLRFFLSIIFYEVNVISCFIARLSCLYSGSFTKVYIGVKSEGNIIKQINVGGTLACIMSCLVTNGCAGVNHNREKHLCELAYGIDDISRNLKNETGWKYYTSKENERTQVGSFCNKHRPCGLSDCQETCEPPFYKCGNCSAVVGNYTLFWGGSYILSDRTRIEISGDEYRAIHLVDKEVKDQFFKADQSCEKLSMPDTFGGTFDGCQITWNTTGGLFTYKKDNVGC